MPLTFTRIPEIGVDDPVSSRSMRLLSGGIRERVLSGLGDAAWRYVFYWVSAMRQARNPDATGYVFPPQNEWLQYLNALAPDQPWGSAIAGGPEGVNRASTFGSYVFGAGDIEPESVRMTDPSKGGVPLESAETPAQIWALGKVQRGAYDPATGSMASPSWSAGLAHYSLMPSALSPHGNSYGGFFPTPLFLGDCDDGTSDTPATPNFEIKFTNLRTGAVKLYPGTCPEEPTHVARVISWALGYYVVRFSGAIEYLPRTDWIEGPYSGGRTLSKAFGDHVGRAMNRWAGEFRGDEERHAKELRGSAPVLGKAFDMHRFLARQYLLAPARGREIDDRETVVADYPRFTMTGATSAAAGAAIGPVSGPQSGFVWAAYLVRSTKLLSTAQVQLRRGAEVLGSATISPTSPDAIVVLQEAVTDRVQFRLGNQVRFADAQGRIDIEVAELWAYRPMIHDLMVVLRLGGCRPDDGRGTDGSGLREAEAKAIWEDYAATGCVRKLRADQEVPELDADIGRNAIYDMARRWSRTVRVITRHNVVGYSVEDGDSCLWIDPIVTTPTGVSVNLLEGITDAITETAPARGWSNRWVMLTQSFRYSWSGTSIWSTDNLADYETFTDRCVHWTRILPAMPTQLQRHFNLSSDFSARRSWAPEVASGYRYALGLNSGANEAFYRSCQIYQPPPEIRSAKPVTIDGRKLVKVRLKGRLHHHHSLAPSAIARDVGTWDPVDVRAEALDYRTEENAIREWLLHQDDPTYQCEWEGPGNASAGSDILTGTDTPFGACLPVLWLVQIPSDPWDDPNDRPDPEDSPMTHEQMSQHELWLRVMTEGCVDGKATEKYGCEAGIDFVFDLRWETHCFQTIGRPWISTLPIETTRRLKTRDVRADGPMGFGPLPTVPAAAETFNAFVKLTNALTDYRVMLPHKFEIRTFQDEILTPVTEVYTPDGAPRTCPGATYNPGWSWTGNPGNPRAATEVATWAEADAAASSWIAGFGVSGADYLCSGDAFVVFSKREDQEYRWVLVDPDAQYAIPAAWRNQLEKDGRLLAIETTTVERVQGIPGGADPTGCNGNFVWQVSGQPVEWRVNVATKTLCEFRPSRGRVVAPAPGIVTFIGASGTPLCNELPASTADVTRVLSPVPTDAIILRVPLVDPEDA